MHYLVIGLIVVAALWGIYKLIGKLWKFFSPNLGLY
jgi:hypothetical protein